MNIEQGITVAQQNIKILRSGQLQLGSISSSELISLSLVQVYFKYRFHLK